MKIDHLTSPSYQELRPFKAPTSGGFPVYRDLVERLAATDAHPDDDLRFVMAVCASYAYGDAGTLAMIMTRLGLEQNHCLMVSVYVDAMFLTSVAYLIQSRDGRVVILCYRGTPPTSAITWLTDLQVDPVKVALEFHPPAGAGESYEVHGGFYRNVRSTRHQIMDALERALGGCSVEPDGAKLEHGLEALYITGHSLGGASAQMLAAMMFADPAYAPLLPKLKAVYTYGAPMIGSPEFAAACDGLTRRGDDVKFLRQNAIRYVYDADLVPQVPPTAAGDFAHFGREYRFTASSGGWQPSTPRPQIHSMLAILAAPASFLCRQFRRTRKMRFQASLIDHFPQYYVDALTPEDKRSEFGD